MDTLSKILRFKSFVTPQKTALQIGEKELSYFELDKLSNQVANYLTKNNYKIGDKLGIISLNSIEVPVLIFGALKSGVIPVQINWWFTPSDVEKLYQQAELKQLIYGSTFQELQSSISESLEKKSIASIMDEIVSCSSDFEDKTAPSDEAFQIYTSGTTGIPKGTVLTHENLITMIRNISSEFPGFGCNQVSLIAVPMFNIAGLGYLLLTIINGGKSVLLPSFQVEAVLKSLETDGITNVFLPPALIYALCQNISDVAEFKDLKLLHYGGAPISRDMLKLVHEKFKCELIQGYGLTETSGIISLLRTEDHKRIFENEDLAYIESAGKIVAGVEIKIVNEKGQKVKTGEIGELLVKGPSVMKGYWKTDNSHFFENEWFKTGDFARQDSDGYLYIVDRKNDLIITKGINVYPSEIEKVLLEHPGINEVCVFSLPSEEYGDLISAAVIVKDSVPTQEQLETWSRERLSGFKLPRNWFFLNEFPKNLSGKVVRKILKEQLLKNIKA